jgi:hypothetical protein
MVDEKARVPKPAKASGKAQFEFRLMTSNCHLAARVRRTKSHPFGTVARSSQCLPKPRMRAREIAPDSFEREISWALFPIVTKLAL